MNQNKIYEDYDEKLQNIYFAFVSKNFSKISQEIIYKFSKKCGFTWNVKWKIVRNNYVYLRYVSCIALSVIVDWLHARSFLFIYCWLLVAPVVFALTVQFVVINVNLWLEAKQAILNCSPIYFYVIHIYRIIGGI